MKSDLDYLMEILSYESAEEVLTMHKLWLLIERAKRLKELEERKR